MSVAIEVKPDTYSSYCTICIDENDIYETEKIDEKWKITREIKNGVDLRIKKEANSRFIAFPCRHAIHANCYSNQIRACPVCRGNLGLEEPVETHCLSKKVRYTLIALAIAAFVIGFGYVVYKHIL